MSGRRGRLSVGLGVAGLVAGGALWGLGTSASAATTGLFTSSTPGFQASAATVPAGICFVTITADGGHGGSGSSGDGGVGATVTARVAVSPGEVLAVQVAGAGANTATGGAGGVGGGGGGQDEEGGGSGGGASAVSGAGDPFLVAGGGGGGGPIGNGGAAGVLGGDGGAGTDTGGGAGGTAAGTGGAATFRGGAGGSVAGAGGTSPLGGNGGSGTGTIGGGGGGGSASQPGIDGGAAPGTGSAGNGASADGGSGNTTGGKGGNSTVGAGGGGGIGFAGGGGGYISDGGGGAGYGGGAGGSGAAGGGGGGSSHLYATGATNVSSMLSSGPGDGQVTISYDPTTDSCPQPTTTTTQPTTTTTTAQATATTQAPTSGAAVEPATASLPATGSDHALAILFVGIGAIALGMTAVVVARRRERSPGRVAAPIPKDRGRSRRWCGTGPTSNDGPEQLDGSDETADRDRHRCLVGLAVSACSGSSTKPTASSAPTSSTSPSSTTAPANAGLRPAVEGYSAAYLGDHPDAAYALLSARCQAQLTHDQVVSLTHGAHLLYGSAKLTSYQEDEVVGDSARVTYAYDQAAINQSGQRSTREGGQWHWDGC